MSEVRFGRGMTDGASQKQGVCKQNASVREAANLRGPDQTTKVKGVAVLQDDVGTVQ